MKRRDLLTSTTLLSGTALAGCLSRLSGGTNEDAHLEVTNLQLDPQPEQVEFTIDVIDSYLTENAVPVVNILVENDGDEIVRLGGSSSPGQPWPNPLADPNTIGFERLENLPKDFPEKDGCPSVERIWSTLDYKATILEPGEAIEDPRGIIPVKDHFDGNCPPAETYRSVHRDIGGESWGFTFELKRL